MKRLLLIPLIFALAFSGACGGNRPPKEIALQAATSTNQGLDLIQDVEAQLCWGTTTAIEAKNTIADLTKCTTPVAAHVGLTTEKHQAFNKALVTAYKAHLTMAADLRLWSAGMPTPTSVNDYVTEVTRALELAKTLVSSNPTVQLLIADALALVKSGQDIIATLKGVVK